MRKVILLLALPLLLLTSCKEDVSDVFVMAKDVENTAFVQSGNKLLIRVQAISDNYKVDRIRIYSVDAEKGSVQLKDTLVGASDAPIAPVYVRQAPSMCRTDIRSWSPTGAWTADVAIWPVR